MRLTVAETEWRGIGIHSGADCRVVVRPAPAGHGICFDGIEAHVRNIVSSTNCTSLPRVQTIEHLLAAFAIVGVTDADVHVEGGEVPALDGSAQPFVDGLRPVQIEGESPRVIVLRESVHVELARGGRASAVPSPQPIYRVAIDFPGFGRQEIEARPEDGAAMAAARTFSSQALFLDLRTCGLARGASEDTLLLVDDDTGDWNLPLRFLDEPVRHKWLDLFGDLALLGRLLVARIDADRPSHMLNQELVAAIWRQSCTAGL